MSLFGNTSGAPSFSFGAPASTQQPATSTPAPSLFGAAPAATAPAGGGLFGALKPAAPSLFGSTSTSAPPPAPGGGLFGTSAAAPAASKPAFSFGAPAPTASAPPATGGLFGSTATSQPQQQQGGGGLFGQAPQQTGGLGGSLFGQQSQAQGAGGLFGSQQPGAVPQGLGASTGAPAAGAISKTTKFNDLPDAARNAVEEIDKFIRQQCTLADDLKAKDLGSDIASTQRMYEQYSAEAATVSSLLQMDSRLLSALRAELEQSLTDLTKTTLLIEGFKAPQSPKAQEAKQVATFPYEFFRRKTDEMKDRVGRYKATMDQISALLSSPSHALSPSSIIPTLKAQHASLVSLASAVSALDLDLKQLKDAYRAIYRDKTGRLADPFRVNGSGAGLAGVGGVERGVGGMAIR
ncbi:uncharacterized protein RHOBADRAFT_52148 [Rhodotorula graminis WP1]|uniref:Nucleoporin Nup54 alpha-helical domain-containing protein n=1 Tax=Rhodotorula graminis (strain WP1) TaxID=578459 RepID=A0A194S9E5_RHOGW|nr:uncharacterized protein RHOBADRAFT_52148 [Rhodotorula graminis WP1]KPV77209.1 hypothetical protein RHOBADRAFT_52148 [Rhodotorula graminis WP1]